MFNVPLQWFSLMLEVLYRDPDFMTSEVLLFVGARTRRIKIALLAIGRNAREALRSIDGLAHLFGRLIPETHISQVSF